MFVAADAAPPAVRFAAFRTFDGRTVRRKDGRGIVFHPARMPDMPGYVVAEDKALGVDVWARSDAELVESLEQALAVNWKEYAEEKPEALTREAKALRRLYLDTFEVVSDSRLC